MKMVYDSEPGDKGACLAHELRELADVIERCPELADEPDPVAAAQRLLDDLDDLDYE
jgi:hypothetical protein